MHNVDLEIFVVKIFSWFSQTTKIKNTKYILQWIIIAARTFLFAQFHSTAQWRIQRGLVPWVLWNFSFEGLPSKILCANVLRTLRSHWSYALQLHSSNNARVSPHSCIKNSTRAWPTCTYNERSEQANYKAKVLFMHCFLCS